ncbi:MAG: hypothetical protein ABIA93_05070 [Candidatus Woesearchaeota archaeon]
MKTRYKYVLFAIVPAILLATIITFSAFGFLAGLLWIFLFGDQTWPKYAEIILIILTFGLFTLITLSALLFSYKYGKKREMSDTQSHAKSKRDLTVLIIITVVTLIIILGQQLSVGNIGTKTEGEICSDYCSQLNYRASGSDPKFEENRSCYCIEDGQRVADISIEDLKGLII